MRNMTKYFQFVIANGYTKKISQYNYPHFINFKELPNPFTLNDIEGKGLFSDAIRNRMAKAKVGTLIQLRSSPLWRSEHAYHFLRVLDENDEQIKMSRAAEALTDSYIDAHKQFEESIKENPFFKLENQISQEIIKLREKYYKKFGTDLVADVARKK